MQAACKGVEDTSNASYEHLTRKLSPPSESKQGTEKVTQFNPLAKMRKAGGRGIAEEEEEEEDRFDVETDFGNKKPTEHRVTRGTVVGRHDAYETAEVVENVYIANGSDSGSDSEESLDERGGVPSVDAPGDPGTSYWGSTNHSDGNTKHSENPLTKQNIEMVDINNNGAPGDLLGGVQVDVLPLTAEIRRVPRRRSTSQVNPLYDASSSGSLFQTLRGWLPTLEIHEKASGLLATSFLIFVFVMSERMWKNV